MWHKSRNFAKIFTKLGFFPNRVLGNHVKNKNKWKQRHLRM